ncbi:kinase-like domain-containing protein [Mucidula mucida]|nr:kinase-like domain-containing protein [Mucidula mucida]
MTSPQNPSFARRGDDPKMIGYWKVGRTIGKGSSGRVKVARHAKTGQMAAVKIIPKAFLYSRMESLNNAADEAERFELALQREIVIMKLIDHPNIMKLYDVWDTTHHLYLILEHVQGGELFDLLCEQGRLSSQEALRYFQQIIAALDYLHRFNIVHRDLKPENILLDAQRNVKLADFGMAAWQSDSLLQTSCGSPHYAAPEIVNGLEYDGAISDIWSCGIILHAMLAGHLPFDDEDCTELLEKVRLAEFEMPQEIEPLAQDLISKMLTKDVSMRITISGIQSHPFFTSESFDFDNPPPLTLYDLALPIASPDEIDLELLRHLHTLWPNSTDEELISCLVSEERNCHKGIYQLLTEYRRKELEDYDEAEELAKVERLRRQTFKAQRREQETARREHRLPLGPHLTPSPSSIPPRNDPPTPRRAARSGGFSASSSEESLLSKRENRPEITLCSPSNSGRSSIHAAEVPLVAPEHQDAHMRTFLNQVATHINVLYSRTEGPQSPTSVNSPILAFMRELGSQPLYVLTPDPPNQVSTGNVYPLSAGAYTDVKPLSVSKREQLKRATIIAEKENMTRAFFLLIMTFLDPAPTSLFMGNRRSVSLRRNG